MLQVPTFPNYQLQQPNYNAVKIDIHNPSVGGPATCPQPQMMPMPQVAGPIYNYPQAQVYDYPQAVQPPYYMPYPQQPVYYPTYPQQPQVVEQQPQVVQQAPAQQAPAQPAVVAQQPAAVQPAPAQPTVVCPPCPNCNTEIQPQVVPPVAVQPAPQQVNINQAPVAPAPAVPQAQPAPAAQPVDVAQPAPAAPLVDLNGFVARLANPDYEVQANTMEEIANMVKDEPVKATELLDAKIIDALINIMNADSSKLAGPTQEQIAARQKLMSGQQISDADKALATTITPMEQAERNKSYAMFTSAILQKLYGEEVAKLTGTTVPLTELPAAMNVVDQLKDNPNPMVRSSAIEALSYIQTPEYKKDLTTLFTIAQKDQDKNVQEAATAALEKLNQI
ncbi:MAG: HEAT repeat domain-containing protein [Cyanobacteria bacterium SIG32]|nr:HEAT repeat domain-containing protein [Cyanobacteria bacterium SIG32]